MNLKVAIIEDNPRYRQRLEVLFTHTSEFTLAQAYVPERRRQDEIPQTFLLLANHISRTNRIGDSIGISWFASRSGHCPIARTGAIHTPVRLAEPRGFLRNRMADVRKARAGGTVFWNAIVNEGCAPDQVIRRALVNPIP